MSLWNLMFRPAYPTIHDLDAESHAVLHQRRDGTVLDDPQRTAAHLPERAGAGRDQVRSA
jgi:hypothetical protein